MIGLGLIGCASRCACWSLWVRALWGWTWWRPAAGRRRRPARCAAPNPTTRAYARSSRCCSSGAAGSARTMSCCRRWRLERAGRGRRPSGPGPARVVDIGKTRPTCRECLLRQGAGRPFPVVRAGSVRPAVRAGGHRLPGRVRPWTGATQPGLLPGPGGRWFGRRHHADRRHPSDRGGRGRLRQLGDGSLKGIGFLLPTPSRIPAPSSAPCSLRRPDAHRSGRPAATVRNVRLGFIGAGNYATSMLLPHLRSDASVDLVSVATTRALSGVNAQRKFGFGTSPRASRRRWTTRPSTRYAS